MRMILIREVDRPVYKTVRVPVEGNLLRNDVASIAVLIGDREFHVIDPETGEAIDVDSGEIVKLEVCERL